MFVVVWEPKRGPGGGHQLVSDFHRANRLQWRLRRERPDHEIHLMTVAEHSAAAVVERQRRQGAPSHVDTYRHHPVSIVPYSLLAT